MPQNPDQPHYNPAPTPEDELYRARLNAARWDITTQMSVQDASIEISDERIQMSQEEIEKLIAARRFILPEHSLIKGVGEIATLPFLPDLIGANYDEKDELVDTFVRRIFTELTQNAGISLFGLKLLFSHEHINLDDFEKNNLPYIFAALILRQKSEHPLKIDDIFQQAEQETGVTLLPQTVSDYFRANENGRQQSALYRLLTKVRQLLTTELDEQITVINERRHNMLRF